MVPSTVQLVDARSGSATTLYESGNRAAWDPRFEYGLVVVEAEGKELWFDLDGSAARPPRPQRQCDSNYGNARIDGREYAGITCGQFSPDGRWMTYHKDAGELTLPSGYVVPQWDRWVLELGSGAARELQAGLIQCGGCDARYGPRWSASSRYVAYAESGGDQRRFVSDVRTGETREIGEGDETPRAPHWARDADLLLYASGTSTRIANLATGTDAELPIPWPATFDLSGRFVYSPAWDDHPKVPEGSGGQTAIFDLFEGAVVATLEGIPPWEPVQNGSSVASAADGYVIALQKAAGCDGTAVYRQGASTPACVNAGAMGYPAPGGERVAVTRNDGPTGSVHGPTFESASLTSYSILVVVADTGRGAVVVSNAVSDLAPLVRWNDAGTHFVVIWPHMAGL